MDRLLTQSSSTDPHSHHYSTHLTLVSFALASNPVDITSAIHSLDVIHSLSERWGDPEVGSLALVCSQKFCELVADNEIIGDQTSCIGLCFTLVRSFSSLRYTRKHFWPGLSRESQRQGHKTRPVPAVHVSYALNHAIS